MLEMARTIYKYRVLIHALVVRELVARYRGSVFGFLWTFLNPLLLMLVYSFVFAIISRSDMQAYAVFMFSGLLPWLWFSSSLLQGVNSIIGGRGLITKSMFPAEILPIVFVLSNLMNFIFTLPILFIFLLVYGITPGFPIVFLPLIIAIQLLLSMGLALILAAVNVHFRDLQHILENLLTLIFFATPIIYPVSQVPEKYHTLLLINPLTALSMSYQNIFYYKTPPELTHVLYILGIAFLFLWVGIGVFDKLKDTFAEEI